MPFDAHCGERLRSERIRLGLKQQEMADEIGVRREMWSKYERGVASPGGDVIEAMARLKVDLTYVLTGVSIVAETPGRYDLSPREQALIENYRGTDDEGRRAVEVTATALAHKDGGQTKRQGGE